ncbi:MAG: peptide ABC transporter substrate-binding protein [Chloroflexi bacterium]|nr:peptide ABC transporter substrate-binding protein [Chloroflexota bacterium]
MNERKLLIGLGAVVGVLVLAVIGITAVIIGQGSGSSSNTKSTGGSGATSGPRVQGELRLPGNDPLTLDPALVTDVTSATYIVEVFGGLVTLDKDLKIVSDIAKSWDISPDGTKYTFKLREDVSFSQSGRKVTASDFKYSMERAARPDTNSPTADTYLGDIVGAKDMIRNRAKDISGIKVIDDYTLEITIDAAKPYFLAKMTFPTAFVVNKDQVEKDKRTWTQRPDGTGPFKLQEWKIGERVILVPNDRYHGDPKPTIKKVTYNLAGGSSLTQYENGEIDLAGVGINDIERIRDKGERLNKEFVEKPGLTTSYIAFNTKQPPFDDPKVRQAFGMAIDKQRIVDVVLKKIVPPAEGILPPGMPGFNPDIKGLPFDATRAKQLLQESKYQGRLPRVVMTLSGQGQNVGPTIEAILEMWKQNLGVEVEVEQVESGTFFQDVRRNKYQMWELGWSADYPDPENFLDILFFSESRQNETQYNNPEVDNLIKQARTEKDREKRFQIYNQIERLIIQDAPWIPLFWGSEAILIKPYVKGYQAAGLVIPILRYITIEQ